MDGKRDIGLVIFDCDGVLIDSEVLSANILIAELAKVGVHVDFQHIETHFLGRSWAKVASEVRQSHGLSLEADFEEAYRRELLQAFETALRTIDGIENVLDSLCVPFCAATSSSPKRAMRSLELSGLASRFGDRVYTASQVANGKPAPDLFLFAASANGIEPRNCLVIEDSIPGLEAGLAAAMTVWRFTGGSHFAGRAPDMPATHAGVTVFDKWTDFFEMAPQLRRI